MKVRCRQVFYFDSASQIAGFEFYLPDARRYPRCAAEYEEILKRHNTVAAYVLGDGSSCSLFVARFGENRKWSDVTFLPLVGDMPKSLLRVRRSR